MLKNISTSFLFLGLLLIAISTSTTLPQQCTGSSLTDSTCNWYLDCLQNTFNCGSKGYPIGYGYKYCSKFSQLQSFPAVTEWINSTLTCLKQSLLSTVQSKIQNPSSINCDQLKKQAFDTHPICYQKGGFCELPKKLGQKNYLIFLDQLLKTFQLKDFQSQLALKQIYIVLKDCAKQQLGI